MADVPATQTISANGNTAALLFDGGQGHISVYGTFGSGTAKLQFSFDESTWIDEGSGTSFTANGHGSFTLPACSVRVNLAGATGPSLTIQYR